MSSQTTLLAAAVALVVVSGWPRGGEARSLRRLTYPGDVKPRVVTIEEAQRFQVPKELRFTVGTAVVSPGSVALEGRLRNTSPRPVEVVAFPVESAYPFYLQPKFTKAVAPRPTAGPRRPPRPPRPVAFTVPGNAEVIFKHRLDCATYLYRGTPTLTVTWTFHYWNPPKPTGRFTVRLPDSGRRAPVAPAAPAAPAARPEAPPKADPAPRRRTVCDAERWGGWAGNARCRRASRRWVSGKHRRCDTSADCFLTGTGCAPHGVNRRYAKQYERWYGPCTNPAAGACVGPSGAFCSDGCCEPRHGRIGSLEAPAKPTAKPGPGGGEKAPPRPPSSPEPRRWAPGEPGPGGGEQAPPKQPSSPEPRR